MSTDLIKKWLKQRRKPLFQHAAFNTNTLSIETEFHGVGYFVLTKNMFQIRKNVVKLMPWNCIRTAQNQILLREWRIVSCCATSGSNLCHEIVFTKRRIKFCFVNEESFLAAPLQGQTYAMKLYSRSAESNFASRMKNRFLLRPQNQILIREWRIVSCFTNLQAISGPLVVLLLSPNSDCMTLILILWLLSVEDEDWLL